MTCHVRSFWGTTSIYAFSTELCRWWHLNPHYSLDIKMSTDSSRKVLEIIDFLLEQGFKNSGPHITWPTTFFMVAPDICGSSIQNLLHATFPASTTLSWLLHFGKYVHPSKKEVSTKGKGKSIQQSAMFLALPANLWILGD
jgi:hypothetical protein